MIKMCLSLMIRKSSLRVCMEIRRRPVHVSRLFLLRELNEELRLWDVLVDPARKIRIGNKLYFGDDDSMVAEVIDNTTSRGRTLRFLYDGLTMSSRKLCMLWERLRCPVSSVVR